MKKIFGKKTDSSCGANEIIMIKNNDSNNNNNNNSKRASESSSLSSLPTLSKLVFKIDKRSIPSSTCNSENDNNNNNNNNSQSHTRRPSSSSSTASMSNHHHHHHRIINTNDKPISNNSRKNRGGSTSTAWRLDSNDDSFEPSSDTSSDDRRGEDSCCDSPTFQIDKSQGNPVTMWDGRDRNHSGNNENNSGGAGNEELSLKTILIVNTIKNALESVSNDESLVRAVSSMPTKFKDAFESLIKVKRIEDFSPNQNFAQIQATHSNEKRFVDREFPACNQSIFYTDNFKYWLISQARVTPHRGQFVWKRAKDLVRNAQFAIDDETNQPFSPFNYAYTIDGNNFRRYFRTTDLDQGYVGNCWFVSAATGIIQNFSLFRRVVPFDNTFEDSHYTGAFHFRFWIYGTWKDVVIDDYLPVTADNTPLFCKNRDSNNEFWCALLEKAYAKLCGSYEALEGGFTTDALIDMSGGIEECYNLDKLRESLLRRNRATKESGTLDYESFWDILTTARKKCSVIGCNIELKDPNQKEQKLKNGLVQGHAYIVTKVAELNSNDRLIRLYNPWGNDVEWNGDWSDKSHLWRRVDERTKERLELKIENDGEFWMNYDDWLKNFDNCQICNLTPDTICDINEDDWQNARLLSNIFSMWQCVMFHGKWQRGVSAGGRGQLNEEKYWTNPQFTFNIHEADVINNDGCWVIVGLMQKNTRQKRIQLKVETAEEYIQFRLYQVRHVDSFNERLHQGVTIDSTDLERINSSGPYTNKREVTSRFALKPGTYVLIPSCYDEDVEGEFLIRIFTEKPLSKNDCKSLDTNNRGAKIKFKKISNSSTSASSSSNNGASKDALGKELSKLSLGAANAFHAFMHIATDFAKSSTNTSRASKSVQPSSPPPSVDVSIDGTRTRRLSRRETTLESIESSSGDESAGANAGPPGGGGAPRLKKPQISCTQS